MPRDEAPTQIKPKRLGDYLDVMSRSVFQSGISWKVVESKWPDIQAAFHDFDTETVAAMSEAEIDALAEDPRVIRNRRKLEAIVTNANRMLEVEAEHGTFKKYLRSQDDFWDRLKMLRKDFKFLGNFGGYHFLYVVGEPVPDHEEFSAKAR